jgi:nicotinate dehydrogenase subunit B
MSAQFRVTRRVILGAAAGLLVEALAPRVSFAQPGGRLSGSLRRNPDLDTWLKINADGTVNVFSGKVELGQGIRTALAQIVADELDVAIERITMETVDTVRSPNEGRTVGSNSVHDSGSALRAVAADARMLLLANAAKRLGVEASRLGVDDGRIVLDGRPAQLDYWQLLGDGRFDTRVSGSAPTKTPEQYRYVGRPQPRLDLPAKFFGEPAYIQDVRLPGMLHARVVRPGVGLKLVALDEGPVRKMPGVVSIVRDGSFLAVVTEREEQAVNAALALERAGRWERDEPLPQPSAYPQLLRELPIEESIISDSTATPVSVARELEAEYTRPYLAHASIGPSTALAQWDGTTLTVYSHAQGMYPLREAIATVVGLPESQVRCIHKDGAGCYGHNGAPDVACDVAIIAIAVHGRPVRLQWTRHDEFRNEPYGSAMNIRVRAGLDANNRIVQWRYDLWSCTHSTRPSGGEEAGNMLAANEKAKPIPEPHPRDGTQPAGGADRNSIPLYKIANQKVTEHLVVKNPIRVSALRSLGAYANVFAIESFVGELARAAKADPFEFRLQHLDDPRAGEVIRTVKARSEAAPTATGPGRVGRGLAFARYKNLSTYVAVVAEVSVDESSGAIRFLRAWAAVDAGQIVNADGIKNQIEGGIVQSSSWTLKEAVAFAPAGIKSVDWATYPILRFAEVPQIEVTLIDRPELEFLGAGEAAQGPTAAAIANAVEAAVGIRLRSAPLTPQRVLAAIEARDRARGGAA